MKVVDRKLKGKLSKFSSKVDMPDLGRNKPLSIFSTSRLLWYAHFAAAYLTGVITAIDIRRSSSSPPSSLPTSTRCPPPVATEEPAKAESDSSILSCFIESNSDVIDALRTVLYQKPKIGANSEALVVLRWLIAAQPTVAEELAEWKFLAAWLINEMGEAAEALCLYEEILADDPLYFEALFENVIFMDQCGKAML